MDVAADVALFSYERRPRVQADSDQHPARCELVGDLGRSREGAPRRRESDEERVALCVNLDSPVSATGFAHDAPVFPERLRVSVDPELAQERRRALDVREEERDRSGRKVRTHGYILALSARRAPGPPTVRFSFDAAGVKVRR